MNDRTIRLLIADDHSLMRMGLHSLIDSEADMTVVGEADNGEDAVRLADELGPDVVVLDLMMPRLSGAEAVRRIHSAHPEIRTLVLTSYGTSEEMSEAIRNGADATLLKDTATDDFTDAVRAICRGEKIIPAALRRTAEEMSEPLSERQLTILAAVTKGFSNPDIARQLGISEIGVKKQVSTILARLGASSRAEAAAIALRRHLVRE